MNLDARAGGLSKMKIISTSMQHLLKLRWSVRESLLKKPPENDDLDERLEREGGKTGAVQISLPGMITMTWIYAYSVRSGERIYFNNKESDCGGELDVDMNVKPVSNNAVENVVWPKNPPKVYTKSGFILQASQKAPY